MIRPFLKDGVSASTKVWLVSRYDQSAGTGASAAVRAGLLRCRQSGFPDRRGLGTG